MCTTPSLSLRSPTQARFKIRNSTFLSFIRRREEESRCAQDRAPFGRDQIRSRFHHHYQVQIRETGKSMHRSQPRLNICLCNCCLFKHGDLNRLEPWPFGLQSPRGMPRASGDSVDCLVFSHSIPVDFLIWILLGTILAIYCFKKCRDCDSSQPPPLSFVE